MADEATRDGTASDIKEILAACQEKRLREGDQIVTNGVVVYWEPMSGVLLIVPIEQGESGVDSPTLE